MRLSWCLNFQIFEYHSRLKLFYYCVDCNRVSVVSCLFTYTSLGNYKVTEMVLTLNINSKDSLDRSIYLMKLIIHYVYRNKEIKSREFAYVKWVSLWKNKTKQLCVYSVDVDILERSQEKHHIILHIH